VRLHWSIRYHLPALIDRVEDGFLRVKQGAVPICSGKRFERAWLRLALDALEQKPQSARSRPRPLRRLLSGLVGCSVARGRREVFTVVVAFEVRAEVVEEPINRYGTVVPMLRRTDAINTFYQTEEKMPPLRLGDGDLHRTRRRS